MRALDGSTDSSTQALVRLQIPPIVGEYRRSVRHHAINVAERSTARVTRNGPIAFEGARRPFGCVRLAARALGRSTAAGSHARPTEGHLSTEQNVVGSNPARSSQGLTP